MKRKLHMLIMLLLSCSLAHSQYFDKVTGVPPANNFAKGYSASWNDYNNDGLDDLIQTDNNKHNVLYMNMGNGVFVKDTLNPIYTTTSLNSIATCWGDYNNDGRVDLLIANTANNGLANQHNYLFRNDGNGQWTLITDSPIYTNHAWPVGCSMVDYDNDGFLDIFIANTDTVNFLYHNNGDGTFSRRYNAGSIVTDNFYSMTAVWADYDNDGWQDCYVVNYFGAALPGQNNALYHNNHDGTFTKDPALIVNNDAATDQGASWGDYDNDGYPDLFTTMYMGLGTDHNNLYKNSGTGAFTLMSTLQPCIDGNQSYGSAWLDFNNDGKLDLVVANNKSSNRHNFLYRNDGNGVFTNIPTDPVAVDVLRSMGISIADYNNDGYPDIYIDSWSSTTEPGLYRNKGGSNNWLALKLVGMVSNKSAIGARITMWIGGQKQIRDVETTTGLYCSSSFVQTIGLGTATAVDSLIIRWPSGIIQHVCVPAVNQKLTIVESADQTGNNILTFTLPTQTAPAVINATNHTVSCEVTLATDLTSLAPTLTVSPGAIVMPASGSTQNFSSGPVTYTVFAGNCASQAWLVNVTHSCPLPADAGVISGSHSVVQGQAGGYSIDPVSGATGYSWTLPAGASIISDPNANNVLVNFSASAVSGTITVAGTNGCGNGKVSPVFQIQVVPAANNQQNVTVNNGQTLCVDAAQTITIAGGDSYYTIMPGGSVTMIAGQNILYYPGTTVQPDGYLHGYITDNNQFCPMTMNPLVNSPSRDGDALTVLAETSIQAMKVYPNPTTGNFTLNIRGISDLQQVKIDITGMNGIRILSREFTGAGDHAFSISQATPGIYFLHIVSGTHTDILKLVKL